MEVTEEELNGVLDLVEDGETALGELADGLRRLWQARRGEEGYFKLGVTLSALLEDDLLPLRRQRIVALFFLYEVVMKGDDGEEDAVKTSPFTTVLLQCIPDGSAKAPEGVFVQHLVGAKVSSPSTLLKSTLEVSKMGWFLL